MTLPAPTPATSCAKEAIAWYLADGARAHANVLEVLTLTGDRISAVTVVTDPRLFDRFGLPATVAD
jgi:hypothetical protein